MPDEIDRDQEFNEQRLEDMIEQNRYRPGPVPSSDTAGRNHLHGMSATP